MLAPQDSPAALRRRCLALAPVLLAGARKRSRAEGGSWRHENAGSRCNSSCPRPRFATAAVATTITAVATTSMGVRDAENKYQEKQRRRRGLQKTRFYCQVCARQCLDENGFSCHVKSDVHMRNLRKQLAGNEPGAAGATAAAALIARYSDQFAAAFLALLRRTHGDKPVALNRFYQEYIRDRDHVHLNSTRWRSVTAAARHLHAAGRCRLIALDPTAADDTDPPAGPPAADKFLIASVPAKRPPAAPVHDDTPVDVPLAFFGDDDDDQDAPRADNDARTSRLDALVSAAQQRAAAAPVPGSPPPAAAAAAAPLAGRKKLAFSLNKRKRSSNPPGPPG